MARLSVILLGLGRMGRFYLHLFHTALAPRARVLAVADPHIAELTSVLADYEVPHAFVDPHEALSLPGADAVLIASPTSTHVQLVEAAAREGLPIFCEKPLALTQEEHVAALRIVRRAGVPLQVGFMRRFDPAYRRAFELIVDGEIGKPILFKAIGRDPTCPPAHFADPHKSGGLILDMGIHDFDLARWLMGSEVERVSAEGGLLACPELAEVGDIDVAVVNLRFVSGAVGNVDVGRTAVYGYDIFTEVLGTDGSVRVGALERAPLLHLTRRGAVRELISSFAERFASAYEAQLVHFIECVQAGRHPEVGAEDALRAFEIGWAATRSLHQGQPVRVSFAETDSTP
ncbi:MAG: Gfo/Idh/MocA family oxidoreductase [Ardenticatenia bacterium]|nr:Gfo/Idh/MocA family oxidoreductase [Ardenticatenia bacterium]